MAKEGRLITLRSFFYVTGYGIPQEDVDRQFAIGKEIFDQPLEIKAKHAADFANGGYNGA
jgi:isopenicillin N synthase-like dioxygenase